MNRCVDRTRSLVKDSPAPDRKEIPTRRYIYCCIAQPVWGKPDIRKEMTRRDESQSCARRLIRTADFHKIGSVFTPFKTEESALCKSEQT